MKTPIRPRPPQNSRTVLTSPSSPPHLRPPSHNPPLNNVLQNSNQNNLVIISPRVLRRSDDLPERRHLRPRRVVQVHVC